MMIQALIFTFIFCFISLVMGQMGGWSYADPTAPEIVSAAQFAVSSKYTTGNPQFKVIAAKKQVVAGMNYDIVVQVTPEFGSCRVDHYQVWDHFGAKTLAASDTLADPCT